MIQKLSIVLLLAVLMPISSGEAEVPLDSTRLAKLAAIEDATYSSRHSLADSLALDFIAQWPDDATGYYARAVAWSAACTGCAHECDDELIDRELETAIRKAEARMSEQPEDAWNRYILGFALGFQSVRGVRSGRYWYAWRLSVRSVDVLQKLRNEMPSFVDPLLPLGSYHYWRGRTVARLAWLPLVDDTRERGISEMRRAASEGLTTSLSARNMLVWALLDSERNSEAEAVIDSLLMKYPTNRTLLSAKADAVIAEGRWNDAAAALEAALLMFDGESADCHGAHLLSGKYGVVLAKLGRCAEALPYLEGFVEYEPPFVASDRYKELEAEVLEALQFCAKDDSE